MEVAELSQLMTWDDLPLLDDAEEYIAMSVESKPKPPVTLTKTTPTNPPSPNYQVRGRF